MDRDAITAVVKFSVCMAVALALLLVWCFGGDLWFRPVAAVTFVVVAAPVVLLVGIDTGRVLMRRRLGRVATIATRIPQLFLGAVACVGAVGGFGLVIFGTFNWWLQRAGCGFISVCILLWGISLLRTDSAGPKGDASS
jgi:hypothetical protein